MLSILRQQIAAVPAKAAAATFTRSVLITCDRFQSTNTNKSSLYQLRKATGFALAKCKDALEKHNGNIEEAIKWMNEQAQKEGWDKAEKLKDRQTLQGQLVFCKSERHNSGGIIEINCETDFVARSEKFIDISQRIMRSVAAHAPTTANICILNKDELSKMAFVDDPSTTIGDQIALAIGRLGENMSVRRGVIFNCAENQSLGWYMHGSTIQPTNECHFGKYGAIVSYSITGRNDKYVPFDVARQVAQHIVGMSPTQMGVEEPYDAEAAAARIAAAEAAEAEQQVSSEDGEESVTAAATAKRKHFDENEQRLLYQEFIMKPGLRVMDFVQENNIKLHDFVRYQCGEVIDTQKV